MRGCLRIFCLHLDDDVMSWELNNPSDFVAESFFWILVYNRSL